MTKRERKRDRLGGITRHKAGSRWLSRDRPRSYCWNLIDTTMKLLEKRGVRGRAAPSANFFFVGKCVLPIPIFDNDFTNGLKLTALTIIKSVLQHKMLFYPSVHLQLEGQEVRKRGAERHRLKRGVNKSGGG